MAESLSSWLRLRESADAAARSEELTRAVADALDPGTALQALDLGTGTGSNIRYLMERLPCDQRWLALDRDAGLLAELMERMTSWAANRGCDIRRHARGCVIQGNGREWHIDTAQTDLGTLNGRLFAGRRLVTASALLDLVSAQWLHALAGHCRFVGASVLFTIIYNGRFSCAPEEPADALVRGLMNRHQKRDKGLGGPAEGPDAARRAEQIFGEAGFRVQRKASDWRLGPEDDVLQQELIEGWVQAATEMAPDLSSPLAAWRDRRLEHVIARRSRIVVGHDDIAAFHPGPRTGPTR